MAVDNVDSGFSRASEGSMPFERARRELPPPTWLNAEPPPAEQLEELFGDVLGLARERLRGQCERLDQSQA